MATNDPERVFGDVAESYEAMRPSYPEEMIHDMVAMAGVNRGSRVLEIGCGTGKATRLVAPFGVSLTCVDPAEGMLKVARRVCERFDNVEFINTTLEQFDISARFEMVFSAQAFHWVDPEVGFRRAADLLKPGGAFALMWNSPRRKPGPLSYEIDRAYSIHAPEIQPASVGLTRSRSMDAIAVTGMFSEAEVREYRWSLTYSADEWIRLLGTHSDHRILDDSQRDKLLTAIHRAIEENGGEIEESLISTLQFVKRIL